MSSARQSKDQYRWFGGASGDCDTDVRVGGVDVGDMSVGGIGAGCGVGGGGRCLVPSIFCFLIL